MLLLALIGAATTGIGLVITQQITGVVRDLSELAQELPDQLEYLTTMQIRIAWFEFDFSQYNLAPLIDQLAAAIQPLLLGTGSLLASVAASTASLIGMLLMTMVLGFYLLLDFERLTGICLDLVPLPYRGDFSRMFAETGRIWQAFLRGQLILALVIGVVVAAALTFLGLKFSWGLGLIAGLFEFVPLFGPLISGFLAVLVALFQGGNWMGLSGIGLALVVAALFVVIQQVENNILVPRIIGHSLNLHPLVVLLAAVSGGILAGVLGLLLAAPTVATLRVWLGYVYRKTVGMDRPPAPVLAPLAPAPPTKGREWIINLLNRLRRQWRAGRKKGRA
jgi:predicted PurR-regulated permease PerM